MAIATTYANNLLNALLRATSYTGPATVYLSLHTADPGTTGANEVTGGSYARQAITFNAAASKQVASSAQISFTGMPAVGSPGVQYIGFWDAASAGNFIEGGALSAAKVVNAGDTFQFPSGNVTSSVS